MGDFKQTDFQMDAGHAAGDANGHSARCPFLLLATSYLRRQDRWPGIRDRYDRAHGQSAADRRKPVRRASAAGGHTEGYGVPFAFEEYERMAVMMRACKGKMMVSINDHPDIRRAFCGLPMLGLSIKYCINNATGKGQSTSRELVITNWEPGTQTGGLF
ncbi:hypothetical protein DFQ28_011412 [Apophysomyces sp. BC1034]|nr:hypothetical protein DFQ28_011412 [Apophysomyces sp. BC1034]